MGYVIGNIDFKLLTAGSRTLQRLRAHPDV